MLNGAACGVGIFSQCAVVIIEYVEINESAVRNKNVSYKSADISDFVLPAFYIAVHSSRVPVHAHVLAVCIRGTAQAWSRKRIVSCRAPYSAVPPLGGERLRSRALSGNFLFLLCCGKSAVLFR